MALEALHLRFIVGEKDEIVLYGESKDRDVRYSKRTKEQLKIG
jgi:hypothetical protein